MAVPVGLYVCLSVPFKRSAQKRR